MMDANPYQAPVTTAPPPIPAEAADPHTIRRTHINHEASVRSIGLLYYLGAIGVSIMLVVSVVELVRALSGTLSGPSVDARAAGALVGEAFVNLAISLVLLVLQIIGGRGLRKLTSAGRVIGIIFSAIGLIAFPVGTLISAYILYLMVSKKGVMVFSPEYKAIIAATPDVKYKTSIVVWIALGIFGLVILTIAVFGMIAFLDRN